MKNTETNKPTNEEEITKIQSFKKEVEIIFKNEKNKFLSKISREDNDFIMIKCDEPFLKKKFYFHAFEKQINELTRNSLFEMNPTEFFNMVIDNVTNNIYEIEYDDKKSELKITVQIRLTFNSEESIRKFDIKFMCEPFDNVERLTQIVTDLQLRDFQHIDKIVSIMLPNVVTLQEKIKKLEEQQKQFQETFFKFIESTDLISQMASETQLKQLKFDSLKKELDELKSQIKNPQ